jgi:hypothetical protein
VLRADVHRQGTWVKFLFADTETHALVPDSGKKMDFVRAEMVWSRGSGECTPDTRGYPGREVAAGAQRRRSVAVRSHACACSQARGASSFKKKQKSDVPTYVLFLRFF